MGKDDTDQQLQSLCWLLTANADSSEHACLNCVATSYRAPRMHTPYACTYVYMYNDGKSS